MNRVLVAQAAAGLAAFVLERTADDARTPTVVIGYDGRRNSDVFARDSAELFAGAGLRAILLPRLLPTPVLAFAVRHLGADAGVMVTASHNPPNDNGYKVYLGGADDGAQIVSPADAEIAAHIQRIADAGDVGALPRSLGYEIAPESVVDAYIAATAAVAPAPAGAEGLAGSTRRCTAWGGRRCRASSMRPATPRPCRSAPSSIRTARSRRSRSRTPKSPARWISRSRRLVAPTPTS